MDLVKLLGEDLAKQVEEKLGDVKLAVANDGTWLPKSKFDEKLSEIEQLKGEITSRDEQLIKLKESASGNETLLQQIAELQAANETVKNEYSQKLTDAQLSSAVKLALNGKVHDLEIIMQMLNKEQIKLDETGNILEGFEEQVATLKESKSYLFVPEAPIETPQVQQQLSGWKPIEVGGGVQGGEKSLGAIFAEQANTPAPSNVPNPWG